MRHYVSFLVSVMVILVVVTLTASSVAPAALFAQEELVNGPDFSGFQIYFSEANDEPSQFDRSGNGISHYAGLLQYLGAELNVLEWRQGIPADADLVVIPGPSSDSQYIAARLWEYLQRGGHVLILADPIDYRGRSNRALASDGFFDLTWVDWHFRARSDVVVHEGAPHQIDVVERNRDNEITFEFSGEVPTLETDILTRRVNPDHPITSDLLPMLALDNDGAPSNLNSLYFDGARSIEIDTFLQEFTTPLVFTDNPDLYGETDYARYLENGYVEYNVGEDSERGNLALAAAYGTSGDHARVVLIGDVDIVRNDAGFSVSPAYSGSPVYPVNVQFMIRATAWLLGVEPGNVEMLPTPAATATHTVTPTPMVTDTPTPEPTETPADE